MKPILPIQLIPNSIPPRFKWKRRVNSLDGVRDIECEGSLPASVEGNIVSLITLTKEQYKELIELRDENEKLRDQLIESTNEINKLQGITEGLADRIAAQSELLGKKAEKVEYIDMGSSSRKVRGG